MNDRSGLAIAAAIEFLARAVAVGDGSSPAKDAQDGYVASLTEAVMGITAGLTDVARQIERVGDVLADMAETQYQETQKPELAE
jgi:hypothetical protein